MQPLQDRAARVVATTTRAWGISSRQQRRTRAGFPRLRFALPSVRGFFFAI
ncbi:hypothetical protein [Variovorax paradoxus]|uniref:hypothetical protein n=1 Tax=Variovorax paradoxus TaxID=34073 RepID=UPI003D65E0BF